MVFGNKTINAQDFMKEIANIIEQYKKKEFTEGKRVEKSFSLKELLITSKNTEGTDYLMKTIIRNPTVIFNIFGQYFEVLIVSKKDRIKINLRSSTSMNRLENLEFEIISSNGIKTIISFKYIESSWEQ